MKSSLFILLLIPMTIFGSLGAFFFKKYSSKKLNFLLIGLLFYGMGALLNILLLKELPYSIVFPANSLTYVWVILFSMLFLKEKIKRHQILGTIFIVSGVVLLVV